MLAAFVAFAGITWIAGVWLTRATDAIDAKFQLGSAFGGLLLLGIATSLPEIAVAVAAAVQKHYGIIIGTLIGGIAIQTAIMCVLDIRTKAKASLSFAGASLTLVLEAAIVVLVTVASLMAIRTPVLIPHTGVSMASVFIVALWVLGLWLVFRARQGLPWRAQAVAGQPGRQHHQRRAVINHPALRMASTGKVMAIFGLAALATLVAGVGIEVVGNRLADSYHIGSGLFAATVIAFTGALPNLSTGLGSIKLGDYQLAMSDIFGGNAFMPALFVVCDLITGGSVLHNAGASDIWFAALGVLLTTIYLVGLIVRSRRTFLGMGLDSLAVAVLYVVGVVSLTLTHG